MVCVKLCLKWKSYYILLFVYGSELVVFDIGRNGGKLSWYFDVVFVKVEGCYEVFGEGLCGCVC